MKSTETQEKKGSSKSDATTTKYNLGDRVLRRGMSGTDVTHLKNILIDKKHLSGALVKGITLFDEEIEKAVKVFQNKLGIDVDGVVDAQTAYFLKK